LEGCDHVPLPVSRNVFLGVWMAGVLYAGMAWDQYRSEEEAKEYRRSADTWKNCWK